MTSHKEIGAGRVNSNFPTISRKWENGLFACVVHKPTIIFHEKSYSILLVLKLSKLSFWNRLKNQGTVGQDQRGYTAMYGL